MVCGEKILLKSENKHMRERDNKLNAENSRDGTHVFPTLAAIFSVQIIVSLFPVFTQFLLPIELKIFIFTKLIGSVNGLYCILKKYYFISNLYIYQRNNWALKAPKLNQIKTSVNKFGRK